MCLMKIIKIENDEKTPSEKIIPYFKGDITSKQLNAFYLVPNLKREISYFVPVNKKGSFYNELKVKNIKEKKMNQKTIYLNNWQNTLTIFTIEK